MSYWHIGTEFISSGHNLKFRNYLPHDKQLQEGKLAAPELPKFEDPIAAAPSPEKKEVCFYEQLLLKYLDKQPRFLEEQVW